MSLIGNVVKPAINTVLNLGIAYQSANTAIRTSDPLAATICFVGLHIVKYGGSQVIKYRCWSPATTFNLGKGITAALVGGLAVGIAHSHILVGAIRSTYTRS